MRIAWKSIEGPAHRGVVTVHRLEDDKCRVTLQMDYDPKTFVEVLGDKFGIVESRIKGDLERFKRFVEQEGRNIQGWRGEIKAKKDEAQKSGGPS